ncbi:unnamed protein product [Discosporangium mesarthrocarpum]
MGDGKGTLSYITFLPEDFGAFTQLFFDNLSTLLGVVGALFNMTYFGVPQESIDKLVYGRILPGAGVTLLFGNIYYTWMAARISARFGTQYTAQPYGINTPGAFAFVFNIIYPVYFSGTEDTPDANFQKAYNIALAANFISGIISVVLGAFGPPILKIVPPASLLVPVAGIGIAFLGLEQISAAIGAPLVGFITVFTMFLGWHANVRIGWGNCRMPEALQVILVGIALGWITGLNKPETVRDARDLVVWYGPDWSGKELFANFGDVKDYLGIVFPIAVSAVSTSLMCLVSAKNAGEAFPVMESMIADGVGTMITSLFGSPFGTVMYFGHPAYKKSGAKTGYSLMNGIVFLVFSWFGLFALIRSVVNSPTIGPIVLFVGLAITEEAIRFVPERHYAALLVGLFPSICDWVTNISSRGPLADPDSMYNTNLPDLTEGWWGILGFKRGALLVSMVWVAMLVLVIDRRWWQATVWSMLGAIFAMFGIIHVPVAGFDTFDKPVSDVCSAIFDETGEVASVNCWENSFQWQYMTAYIMLAVIFIIIEVCRKLGLGQLEPPIEDDTNNAFQNWFEDGEAEKEIDASNDLDPTTSEANVEGKEVEKIAQVPPI